MKNAILLFALLLLAGCNRSASPTLINMQIVDQNGFSEVINSKERLEGMARVNYFSPQPYQKVLRTYSKDASGCSKSILTSYHKNGQLKQYLEAANLRACGSYYEWHSNGQLRIAAHVLSGHADLTFGSEGSWVFDGETCAYNEEGICIARIPYSKGVLEGVSYHYYDCGTLHTTTPFLHGKMHGICYEYAPDGTCLAEEHYCNGIKEGSTKTFWDPSVQKSHEEYHKGLLENATYWDPSGKIIAEVCHKKGWRPCYQEGTLHYMEEIQGGTAEGTIKEYLNGVVIHTWNIHNTIIDGPEWFFNEDGSALLLITWHMGFIQGVSKSWYPCGLLESERYMHQNQKNGPFRAWYENGTTMFIEEYETDKLIEGHYYNINSQIPVSFIENGRGTATLFDGKGRFLRRITYCDGLPMTGI